MGSGVGAQGGGQLQGTPEIKMGDVVKQKAQPPDWHRIQKTALELFQRTRDIRLAVTLVRALLHTAGLPGCRDGLRLLHGLMEQYWSMVHPHLDEEENNDPTERLNILETLCDWDSMIGPLTRVPVCTAPVIGSITMRDMSIATGKIKTPENIIKNWYNFYDSDDRVSLNRELAANYVESSRHIRPIDHTIYNDYEYKGKTNPHQAYGYLRTPQLAQVIHDFLSHGRPRAWIWLNDKMNKWLQKRLDKKQRHNTGGEHK